jgi:hypothetical protein
MKYIAVILIAGATYLSLVHQTPAGKPASGASQASEPGIDFLKRPLDRTHEVLDQARVRANDQP